MRWSEPKRQHQALTLLGLSADRPAGMRQRRVKLCQRRLPASSRCTLRNFVFLARVAAAPASLHFRPLNMIDAALAFLNRQLPFPLDESSFAACAAVFSVVVALLAIRLSSKPGGSTHQF